ncbi:MAG: flagellar motor switch protein FliM [Acidobacteriota bacterium]
MSDDKQVLSQDEISALFEAMDGEEAGQVQPGDSPPPGQQSGGALPDPSSQSRHILPLRQEQNLTKEMEEALMLVFDAFSYKGASSLEALLRAPVRMKFGGLEQVYYRDLIRNLPEPSSTWYLLCHPGQMHIVICMGPELAHACIALLMGGEISRPQARENVTELEQSVLRGVVELMGHEMERAWSRLVEVALKIDLRETRPRLLQVFPQDEEIILALVALHIGPLQSKLYCGLPTTLMKELEPLFKSSFRDRSEDENRKGDIENLKRIALDFPTQVHARLDHTAIRVEELLALKRGDVLKLEHRVDDPLSITLNGRPKFSGMVVLSHDRRAIEIV